MIHSLYSGIVESVCGENWETSDKETFEGGIGICILLAYMKGIKPTVSDMVEHLGLSSEVVYTPFKRLLHSGVFSKAFDARHDLELLGKGFNNTNVHIKGIKEGAVMLNAYGHIAGISAGLLFRNLDTQFSKIGDTK